MNPEADNILTLPERPRRKPAKRSRLAVRVGRVLATAWFGLPGLFRKRRQIEPGLRISEANPRIELAKCGEDLQLASDLIDRADGLLKRHARIWWDRLHSGRHDIEVTNAVEHLVFGDGGRLCRINVWYYAKAVSDTDPAVMVAAALIQFLCQVKIMKHSEDWLTVLNHERLALKASARFLNRHAAHTGDPEDALTSQAYSIVLEETAPPQL